jgi:hypothetical protein
MVFARRYVQVWPKAEPNCRKAVPHEALALPLYFLFGRFDFRDKRCERSRAIGICF